MPTSKNLLRLDFPEGAMKVKNSDQARAEYVRPALRKVNVGGERADVSTTEGTNSEAPPKKEKKKK